MSRLLNLVITASQLSWTTPLTGLRPRAFRALVSQLRCEGADAPMPGRRWSLPLEERVLLAATYWRTNPPVVTAMKYIAAAHPERRSALPR